MRSSRPIFFDSLLCFAFGFLVCDYFCFAVYIMNYCRVKQRGVVKYMLNCRVKHRGVVKYM